jgi:hypothetical protein
MDPAGYGIADSLKTFSKEESFIFQDLTPKTILREDKHCQYNVSPTGVVSFVLTNGSTFTSGEGESYQAIIEFDLMRNKRETPHDVI